MEIKQALEEGKVYLPRAAKEYHQLREAIRAQK
jgi:hypothetical protein